MALQHWPFGLIPLIHLHSYSGLQEILFIPHHLFLGAVKSFPAKIEVDSVEPDTISIIIVLQSCTDNVVVTGFEFPNFGFSTKKDFLYFFTQFYALI